MPVFGHFKMKKSLKILFLFTVFAISPQGSMFCAENTQLRDVSDQKSRSGQRLLSQKLQKKLIKSIKNGFKFGLVFGLGAAFAVDIFQVLNHIPTKFDQKKPSKVAQLRNFICVLGAYGDARFTRPLKRRCRKLEEERKARDPSFEQLLYKKEKIDSKKQNVIGQDKKDCQEIKDYLDGLKKGENHGYCHCSSPIGHPVGTFICSLFYASAIAGVVTVGFGAATLARHFVTEFYCKIRERFTHSRRPNYKKSEVEKPETTQPVKG